MKNRNTVAASSQFKSVSIEAVKIRADGTRVPLGVISYYNKNPLLMFWWNLKQAIKAAMTFRAKGSA